MKRVKIKLRVTYSDPITGWVWARPTYALERIGTNFEPSKLLRTLVIGVKRAH